MRAPLEILRSVASFRRPTFAILLTATLLPPWSWPAAGREGASFLQIPVGAGPASLGSAYSALATDAYAPVWNPAGLGFLPGLQIAAQHSAYLESLHYEFLSVTLPLFKPAAGSETPRGGALGFAAQYLGSGDIPGADRDGNPLPDYSSHYGAYSLAYGRSFGPRVSLGAAGKWINAKISDVGADAFAADLGAMVRLRERLTLAAVLANVGGKLKFLNDDSALPLAGRLALAYVPARRWRLAAEGEIPKSGPAGAHAGAEWKPLDYLSIRAGYKTAATQELGALAGLTLGAGLHAWGQEFAYAWLPYGDLGDAQYFSLLLRFGENERMNKNLLKTQDVKRRPEAGAEEGDAIQLLEMLREKEEDAAKKAPDAGPGSAP